jgi:glycerophosphoryl diester phosphodiesterase
MRPIRPIAALTATVIAAVLALPTAGTAAPAVPARTAADPAPGWVERFDGTTLPTGWNPVEGTWKVENGRLTGTSANSNQQSRITFGAPLNDYRIEATIRFESVLDNARWTALGLDVAASGAVPWSIATVRTGSTATNGLEFAQRTAQNTWNVTNTGSAPFAAGTGRDVRIAVEVHGSRAVWLFDGREALRTSVVQRSEQGGQALLVNGATVSFDDVAVTPLGRESFIRRPGAPLTVWAHRGASSATPENTAASDEVARRAGAEWIENDVQPTADGIPVILHDATVDRTTDGTGAIRGLTVAQVGALDAGSWFAPAFTGQRVPTLAQQLQGLKQRGGNLLLEIKGRHTRDEVATIVDVVRQSGMANRVFVQSFEVDALQFTRELAPELPLGLLRSTLDPDPVAIAKELGLAAYNPSDAAFQTRPGIAADLHDAGVAVNVWTVDDANRWKALENAGVDGIITNRPAELAGWNAAFRQRAVPTVTILGPGETVDRAAQARVTAAATNADTVTLTLDGTPVANGAGLDLTKLAAGRHVVTAEASGPGGRATTDSAFTVTATPTGLAHLVLTSGAQQSTVGTMSTLVGFERYEELARYALSPAARGLPRERAELIAAEARALA